ncbi:MAG TPA: M12 family metallo-peptidase [Dokdonella sp.]|uniref:M12 family metallo-peptidase n=1 Tax=Dokdonella sp. TaxID=2291710 RepID=UPI0025BD8AF7|nr:M12 family metallo-peptidase [Dokdonella sp.]MBX3691772.1 hypothetical protein [Dokdonella sp.]MCW5568700.1 hypothetical protein [Dokdonella sp.]HNR92239.1 M12 family metallo-peptidase [Dokdonella sp.]
MKRVFATLLLTLFALEALAAPGTVTLGASDIARLTRAPIGTSVELAEFPVGPGLLAAVRFERVDIYAPGARIIEMSASGERELPRSKHVQLIGASLDGSARIALSIDPATGALYDSLGSSTASGGFVLRSTKAGGGYAFEAIDTKAALPPGVVLDYADNVDHVSAPDAEVSFLDHLGAPPTTAASTPARLAVLAIDTDTEFLEKRFSNNTAQAVDWIATLLVQINLIYRNDLDVLLLQGTTLLRVGTDPFSNTDTPASQAQLIEFGNWWSANQGAVPRSFATLLSGKSSSGNSASGIAWVNRYCATSGNGGSYSVNQVFWNPDIGAASNTFLVAHELGHNFGASHTHCSNATTGAYPTATNTIDQCYAGESGQGCYGGATSCPSSGPGAPKGTLMSYCHISPSGCMSNVLQFHPTHVTQVRARITANTPSCLVSEVIFANGFQ